MTAVPHRREVQVDRRAVMLPPRSLLGRLPVIGGVVGVIGLAVSFLLGAGQEDQLYHSYLVAYLFWLSLALGGLFFVLLHHVTRAGWSVAVRRLAEHVMGTLPLFVVLFVPVALGLRVLYPWTHPELVAADPVLQGKAAYLDVGFFYLRAAVYLVCWSFLGWWFRRLSIRQDRDGFLAITRRLQTVSAPAMVVFALTLTLASFDWIMSLDPHWYSTIFGVYVFSGAVVGILSLVILLGLALLREGELRGIVTDEHFHDLGKLLFGFVVFWAYIGFSQYMLMWYAALPEETEFYSHRLAPGWYGATVALAVGHFVLPFFFLLPRDLKRHHWSLTAATLWLLTLHYFDLYWLVMPTLHEGLELSVLDLTTFLGVGGLFAAGVGQLLRGEALIPVEDPRLAESLAFENV